MGARSEGKELDGAQAVVWGLMGVGKVTVGEEATEARSGTGKIVMWTPIPQEAGHGVTYDEAHCWGILCSIIIHNRKLETI